MAKEIYVKGAAENNLKHINVRIPRDQLVVLTGLSGSGKSSLAFDTVYAEGQRRYMESLSSYARQFLGRMEKPNVEEIEGLSPAISIDQKTTSKNPRSTVGTVTEIYDYLRLLYARIGVPHCPVCGREIRSQSVDQIADALMDLGEGTRLTLLAPVVRAKKGTQEKVLDRIRREGFVRVRVDGTIRRLDEEEIKLEKNLRHTIEIVIDRLKVREGAAGRIAEACELAIEHGSGLVTALTGSGEAAEERVFSTSLACPEHGVSIEEMEPRSFSFNSPFGACPACNGLGFTERIDPDLIIEDQDKSIAGGCLANIYASMDMYSSFYRQMVQALADEHGVSLDTPYRDLPDSFKKELLYGTGERHLRYVYRSRSGSESRRDHPFEGVINNLERRYRETGSD